MEFANEYCGGRLLLLCQWQRAEARSLIVWQHAGLSGVCSRISFESAFYSLKRMLTCQEQKEAGIVFSHLEKLLAASPGKYLFGDIGVADFMLVPTVVRLMSHRVSDVSTFGTA
jgi:glutathione S-transferase